MTQNQYLVADFHLGDRISAKVVSILLTGIVAKAQKLVLELNSESNWC